MESYFRLTALDCIGYGSADTFANAPYEQLPRVKYICKVSSLLDNPVYTGLITGDAHLAVGVGAVRYFPPEISPFAGFDEKYNKGFDDLYHELPAGRRILYATRQQITEPKGWKVLVHIAGTQFILHSKISGERVTEPVALETKHTKEMMALAALTKPGPFDERTIEFGCYHGIFDGEKLVAMTGQRLHVSNYTEISAVCTHPDYLGRGYAGTLMDHQIEIIVAKGETPFLHVRSDNDRAIGLYKRLGFDENGPMNFYFLKRK